MAFVTYADDTSFPSFKISVTSNNTSFAIIKSPNVTSREASWVTARASNKDCSCLTSTENSFTSIKASHVTSREASSVNSRESSKVTPRESSYVTSIECSSMKSWEGTLASNKYSTLTSNGTCVASNTNSMYSSSNSVSSMGAYVTCSHAAVDSFVFPFTFQVTSSMVSCGKLGGGGLEVSYSQGGQEAQTHTHRQSL